MMKSDSELLNLERKELEEILALEEELEKRECEASYYEFFKSAWKILEPSAPLIAPPYIKFLCDALQQEMERIIRGEEPEHEVILINIPPASSKSSIVTKFLQPWCWIHKAELRFISSSYSATLANSHATKSRDIIRSPWYQRHWGDKFKMKGDMDQKTQFENTATGQRLATSTGGTVTGFHAHVFIQDDPINPQGSTSEADRLEAENFNNQTIPSRILPGGVHIIVMQRLHEKDPTGIELEKKKTFGKRVRHICLPAQLISGTSPECRDLYIDGYLDPVRFGQKRLDVFKNDLGSFGYAGQFEQSPYPAEGGKFKRAWFQYIKPAEVPQHLVRNLWIDGAYTKQTSNDPSGFLVEAYDPVRKALYLIHGHTAHMEMPEALKFTAEYAKLHLLGSRSRVFYEPKASGKSMRQMLKTVSTLSAVEIQNHLVNEGKEARAQTASPKFEAGRVYIVEGAWNNELEKQLCGFPNAEHDEYIDLVGYVCFHHFDRSGGADVSWS